MSLKPPISPTDTFLSLQSVRELVYSDAAVAAIENQSTPIGAELATHGAYTDSGSGNLFHFSSYVENPGTRATVAVFGGAKGNHVFGGNFVAYSNGSGDVAIGVEIDFGNVSAAGGTGYGLLIKAAGGNIGGAANAGNFIQLQANEDSSPADGIVFHVSGGVQPVEATAGSLIRTNGAVSLAKGIDFGSATFSTAAIVLPPGGDIALNATTGTKIGTSSTQKLAFWGSAPVARQGGWGLPSGTSDRTTFDTETVTLPLLARRMRGVIQDLRNYGIFGT